MSDKVYNVLFLCTANSARSIMAEIILNLEGAGRFRAYSAGSRPLGRVDPHVLELAAELGYDSAGLRSKGWEEFAGPAAPAMDLVITLCDTAAGETCPVWPGHPPTARWSFPDLVPLAAGEDARQHAFRQEWRELSERIHHLLRLPDGSLDRLAGASRPLTSAAGS